MFDKKDSPESEKRGNVIEMTSHRRRQKARSSTPSSNISRGHLKRGGVANTGTPIKLRLAMALQLLILCFGLFLVFRGCGKF